MKRMSHYGCTALAILLVACSTSGPQTLIAPYDLRPIDARYYFSGDEIIYPDAISDDGEKTFIYFNEDRELVAVFGVDFEGDETLVNGHMRSGVYVIDDVYDRLRFRLGDAKADAVRALGGENIGEQ